MFKQRSLLCEKEWEDYDRKIDIGLSTLYQIQSFRPQVIQNTSPKRTINDRNTPKNNLIISQIVPKYMPTVQSHHSLQSIVPENQELQLPRQIFIHKNRKTKLKMRYQTKPAQQTKLILDKPINKERKVIKIEQYHFGQNDKIPKSRSKINISSIQTNNNEQRNSIKQQLKSFINNRKNQKQRVYTHYKTKRYMTINSEKQREIRESHKKMLSPPIMRSRQSFLKALQPRVSYLNFTNVNMQDQLSPKEAQNLKKKIESLSQRQKVMSRQKLQKRRFALYKSNLLRTHNIASEIQTSPCNHRIQLNQQCKLKDIIRRYFRSKYIMQQQRKLIINQTPSGQGQN